MLVLSFWSRELVERGVGNPRTTGDGERPVAELGRVWVFSTQRSCLDQKEGLWEEMQCPFPDSYVKSGHWLGGGSQWTGSSQGQADGSS